MKNGHIFLWISYSHVWGLTLESFRRRLPHDFLKEAPMQGTSKVTNLRRATFVVLDEADELLGQGFGDQVCNVRHAAKAK